MARLRDPHAWLTLDAVANSRTLGSNSLLRTLVLYLDVASNMRVEGHAERHGVVDPRVGVDDQQPPIFRRHHLSSQTDTLRIVRYHSLQVSHHGCQTAIAKFLDRMCLALLASGLWLRYATLQNMIPSFPWIVPHALHPGAIQGKEGIKFCHLATLIRKIEYRSARPETRSSVGANSYL